ncbi:MAG TPA: hypothetical protein VNE71_15180, partial [Myxococcota bacterium]|nr:hypothetical protein [Myxococcota bacterium]
DLDGPGIALELFDATPAGLPDVGENSHPVLADLDDDGDLDVMVAFGIPVNIGRRAYFENLTIDPVCAPAPRTLCAEFSSGAFKVDERKEGKEKLALSLTGGPLLQKDALADPVADPEVAYALCIYDAEGARVANLEVDRFDDICGEKPCWSETAQGFRYADDSTSEDGILAIVLKAGAPGRSKLTLAAANNSKKSHAELVTGLAGELADTTAVTVQVQSSGGACYSRTFSELRKQTPTLFKAR